MAFKIETITAFVAEDKDGEEGIMGFLNHNGHWMPMVCADEKRVASLYKMALDVADVSGKKFKVLRFSVRTDVTEETIKSNS